MSRRKQSNPKPIKRPEDEDEDTDEATKLSQSEEAKEMEGNQSESSLHSEPENEQMDTETEEIKLEPDSPVQVKVEKTQEDEIITERSETETQAIEMSPRRQEVMKRLNFPSNMLTLRQVDEAEFLQTGIPWSITSYKCLPKGSTIGPYHGETVALSSIKPGELVLQFQGSDGEFSFIKVTEGAGAWLSLLRPADSTSPHNTQVVFKGGRIWCEIVENLQQGTELLASFTTNEEEVSPLISEKPNSDQKEAMSRDMRPAMALIKRSETKSIPQITPQPALIYGCPFCGVRFSSRRTLEAHLTYYCSKKPADFVSLQELHSQLQQHARALLEKQAQQSDDEPATSPKMKTEQLSPRGVKRQGEDTRSESPDSIKSTQNEQRNKSPKSSEIFKCSTCRYVTDRASKFKQHQREHAEESSGARDRLSVSPLCQEETFCKECKIQFSSVSTYRGHKEFYCQYRLSGHGKDGDNVSELASPGAHDAAAADLTLKMLKAQEIALENSSLFLGAKGQIHPALLATNPLLASPLFLQDILLKSQHQEALAKSTPLLTSPVARADNSLKHSPAAEEQPLDLSKSKPNKDVNKSSQIVAELTDKIVKSESNSQLSPPAKKMKLSDEKSPEPSTHASKTPLNIPSIHSPLLLGNQVQYVNKKPIPPLQSVSRCVECNIVFYKHENYLIHKEHYCSGRRSNKDSVSSDSEGGEIETIKVNEATSAIKTVVSSDDEAKVKIETPNKTVEETLPENPVRNEICYKYYCIPCKIKFSSAGTLKAHKEFYCPHGSNENSDRENSDKDGERSNSNSSDVSTYPCENCKNEFSSARLLKLHMCMGEAVPSPLLRCLYCDYVTQTDNRLSEHMKVHVPTKAFKCNLCGYRGNTARGMRMHGKMHMENGEEFTDDNMIEFEEPPLVPIQRNGMTEKGPVDMETELIRMKNEPYKRRRSRKSFEKSENMVPFLGNSLLTQICAACGQTFGNVSDFVIHLRMHEIAALEAMKNLKSLRCEHCDNYLADSLTSLLVHMQTKHPEQLPGTSKTSDSDGHSESERSQSRDSHVTDDRSRSSSLESPRAYAAGSSSQEKSDLTTKEKERKQRSVSVNGTKVKREIDLSDAEDDKPERIEKDKKHIDSRSSDDNDLISKTKSQKSPKSVEDSRSKGHRNHDSLSGSPLPLTPEALSRKPVSSPQQPSPSFLPVKSEPKSPLFSRELSKSVSPPNSNLSPTSGDKLSPKLLSPDPKTRYLLSQNIKKEQTTPPPRIETSKLSPTSRSSRTVVISPKITSPLGPHSPKLPTIPLLYQQALLSPYHFPAGIPISFMPTPGIQTSPPIPSSANEKIGRKYCKHCDINFTYLSSFLTHKKYYCSARSSAEDSESPTATA